MVITSPFRVTLAASEWKTLTRIATAHTSTVRDRLRARIVLAADAGRSNADISRRLEIGVDTVRKWRSRYASEGLTGLRDRKRSGRPPVYPATVVAEVKGLACSLPAEHDLPLSRWSAAEIACEIAARGITKVTPAASTVRRWLSRDAIKPWQHRSWIFPRDPDFAAKAGRVLDLYDRTWQGEPLGPDEYVISADEKSQLQALRRRHPGLPPGPGQARRVEFEYVRGGTLAYFAALDVHRGTVIGRCAPSTGIAPFTDLVAQVMTSEPYASARRVFWVVDNGSSHCGQPSIDRLNTAHPNATLVHLPVHASWLNQVEIFFSVVQRKVINPSDFGDLDQLEDRLLRFQDRYNTTAQPFGWRYTRHDLNQLIKRLAQHDLPVAA